MRNTITKSILERKGSIPSLLTDHHEEKSGLEVKLGGPWRQEQNEAGGYEGMLITTLLSLLSYIPSTPCPRMTSPTRGWAFHPSIINQEKTQQICPPTGMIETISQDSLLPGDSRLYQVGKKKN